MQRIKLFDLREKDKKKIFAAFEGFPAKSKTRTRASGFHWKFLVLARMIANDDSALLERLCITDFKAWFTRGPKRMSIADVETLSKVITDEQTGLKPWKTGYINIKERFKRAVHQTASDTYELKDICSIDDVLFVVKFMANLWQKQKKWNDSHTILKIRRCELNQIRTSRVMSEGIKNQILAILGAFEKEIRRTSVEDFSDAGLKENLASLATHKILVKYPKFPHVVELAPLLGDIFVTGGWISERASQKTNSVETTLKLDRIKPKRILVAEDIESAFGVMHMLDIKKTQLEICRQSSQEGLGGVTIPFQVTAYLIKFLIDTENLDDNISIQGLKKVFRPRVPEAVQKEEGSWKPFLWALTAQAGYISTHKSTRSFRLAKSSDELRNKLKEMYKNFGITPVDDGRVLYFYGESFENLQKLGGFRTQERVEAYMGTLNMNTYCVLGETYLCILSLLRDVENARKLKNGMRKSSAGGKTEVPTSYIESSLDRNTHHLGRLRSLASTGLVHCEGGKTKTNINSKKFWWSLTNIGETYANAVLNLHVLDPLKAQMAIIKLVNNPPENPRSINALTQNLNELSSKIETKNGKEEEAQAAPPEVKAELKRYPTERVKAALSRYSVGPPVYNGDWGSVVRSVSQDLYLDQGTILEIIERLQITGDIPHNFKFVLLVSAIKTGIIPTRGTARCIGVQLSEFLKKKHTANLMDMAKVLTDNLAMGPKIAKAKLPNLLGDERLPEYLSPHAQELLKRYLTITP